MVVRENNRQSLQKQVDNSLRNYLIAAGSVFRPILMSSLNNILLNLDLALFGLKNY